MKISLSKGNNGYLADLNLKHNATNDSNLDYPTGFWERDSLQYTLQGIGDMPHWINRQLNSLNSETATQTRKIDIETLNYHQRTAYDIVHGHFLHINDDPLFMIITGLAGSGKSYLIDAIKCLLKEQCKICEWINIAFPFAIAYKGKRNGPLKSSALCINCKMTSMESNTSLLTNILSLGKKHLLGSINDVNKPLV